MIRDFRDGARCAARVRFVASFDREFYRALLRRRMDPERCGLTPDERFAWAMHNPPQRLPWLTRPFLALGRRVLTWPTPEELLARMLMPEDRP